MIKKYGEVIVTMGEDNKPSIVARGFEFQFDSPDNMETCGDVAIKWAQEVLQNEISKVGEDE